MEKQNKKFLRNHGNAAGKRKHRYYKLKASFLPCNNYAFTL